ncbi:hypothetical protein H5410_000758 [Solanum commersonii]|uniref:Uncharacterized protein n=1 Tax=Solanum commersonii TaxID=4109 RepID=A0A9J6AXE0_SOLCO|nr:hypothetical protein H5410_000758 [Solanum commersonii]
MPQNFEPCDKHPTIRDTASKGSQNQNVVWARTAGSYFKKDQEYGIIPQKGIIVDSSIRHIAQKISVQDGDKEAMINSYLEEVNRILLLNMRN